MKSVKKYFMSLLMVFISILGCLIGVYCKKEQSQRIAFLAQGHYSGFGVSESDYGQHCKIIDSDSYGRKMVSFSNPRYDINWEGQEQTSMIMICQKVTLAYVYYYPGENFLLDYGDRKMVSSQEIKELKEVNDWNQPFNISKCIKKKYVWDRIYDSKEAENIKLIENRLEEILYYEGKKNIGTVFYCDTDKNGQKLYALEMNDKPYNYAIIIKNEDYLGNYSFTKIYSAYYQEEITAFKNANNWQYDYC